MGETAISRDGYTLLGKLWLFLLPVGAYTPSALHFDLYVLVAKFACLDSGIAQAFLDPVLSCSHGRKLNIRLDLRWAIWENAGSRLLLLHFSMKVGRTQPILILGILVSRGEQQGGREPGSPLMPDRTGKDQDVHLSHERCGVLLPGRTTSA